jgi:hypothetical protein
MSSSSSKSFFIKDILSKNCKSILSDESNETEDNLLTKPIALRYYFNNIEHLLYPRLLSSSALLLSKSTNDIRLSSLNILFEMHKRNFNKLHISKYLLLHLFQTTHMCVSYSFHFIFINPVKQIN